MSAQMNEISTENEMGRSTANFSTHRPAEGSIRCRRRLAKGWEGRLVDGTAVGEGGSDLCQSK